MGEITCVLEEREKSNVIYIYNIKNNFDDASESIDDFFKKDLDKSEKRRHLFNAFGDLYQHKKYLSNNRLEFEEFEDLLISIGADEIAFSLSFEISDQYEFKNIFPLFSEKVNKSLSNNLIPQKFNLCIQNIIYRCQRIFDKLSIDKNNDIWIHLENEKLLSRLLG